MQEEELEEAARVVRAKLDFYDRLEDDPEAALRVSPIGSRRAPGSRRGRS